MRALRRLLFCRSGRHNPRLVGYDVGMIIECKDCKEVLHVTWYVDDD